MSFVCLWTPSWRTGAASAAELAPILLAAVPRVATDARGILWADARGMNARAVAGELLELMRARGIADVRIGVSMKPIVAEIAVSDESGVHAALGAPADCIVVERGLEAEFLAPLPIDVLSPSPRLLTLLDGTGIATCRDLAGLDLESVEVRLGIEGVRLWRLARAEDRRLIFTEVPRELPHASVEWADYTLADPERLVFILNALAERVITSLDEQGESARELALVLSLANREQSTSRVRFTRPTSNRKIWMRQIRAVLERITLGDAITGVLLRVDAIAAKRSPQGDLFDRGFASAGATEQTLAQLIDDQGEILFTPQRSGHVLLDRRTRWVAENPSTLVERSGSAAGALRTPAPLSLTLQLLPEPQPIVVVTGERRDHYLPLRYRDGATWHDLEEVAGPDRVSGGHWEGGYAREYFRGVRADGVLVWLFRDAIDETWFLHGIWD